MFTRLILLFIVITSLPGCYGDCAPPVFVQNNSSTPIKLKLPLAGGQAGSGIVPPGKTVKVYLSWFVMDNDQEGTFVDANTGKALETRRMVLSDMKTAGCTSRTITYPNPKDGSSKEGKTE